MGYIVVITVSAVSSWCIYTSFKMILRNGLSVSWWVIFSLVTIIGAILGFWTGVKMEYYPNPQTRITGFPVPLVVFAFEGERWSDFVPPDFVQHGAVVANILTAVAFLQMPLGFIAYMVGRRSKKAPSDLTSMGSE